MESTFWTFDHDYATVNENLKVYKVNLEFFPFISGKHP